MDWQDVDYDLGVIARNTGARGFVVTEDLGRGLYKLVGLVTGGVHHVALFAPNQLGRVVWFEMEPTQ